MGIAIGGLGVMTVPMPFALWTIGRLFRVVEIRSMFFAAVVLVVLLILAYLTNPSETSFRQFLTEQSFRQHLSRLDDAQDDQHGDADNIYALSTRALSISSKCGNNGSDLSTPFHFSTRAAVSLRTPKHIFRSFGVLTVAAVVPSNRHCRSSGMACNTADPNSSSMIIDSWFIGAFGKWWWGAPVDGWWRDSIIMAKDEEGTTSGILEIKSLDRPVCRPGSPLISNHIDQHASSKLRLRDRSAHQNVHGQRSSTPPPLPKSASLPLHSKRIPPPTTDNKQQHGYQTQSQIQTSLPSTPEQNRTGTVIATVTPSLSRSPSALFDQSPVISELLRQVGNLRTGVVDLRGHLGEFQKAAADTREQLQIDLDVQRDRKRQDDASRSELKSRTKNLEDGKRHAEGAKREVEKKLKAAESARAGATTRIERLDQEIAELEQRMMDDEAQVLKSGIETCALQEELSDEVQKKRKEIKVAEDVVAALGQRARELEEKIASETSRLQKAREEAEMRRQDRSFSPLHVITPSASLWPPISQTKYGPEEPSVLSHSDVFPTESEPTELVESPLSPKPRALSLTHMASLTHPSPEASLNSTSFRSKGYSIFDKDIASLAQAPKLTTIPPFAPFATLRPPQSFQGDPISPVSSSLIPSSLIQSLEIGNSVNHHVHSQIFQSEEDAILDREWLLRNIRSSYQAVERPTPGSMSPVSPTGSLPNDYDAFEVRPHIHESSFTPMDMQRAAFPNRLATEELQVAVVSEGMNYADTPKTTTSSSRRWFLKGKKGLNPDAKEFSLSKDKERSLSFLLSHSRPSLVPPFEVIRKVPSPVMSEGEPEPGHTSASASTTSFSSSFFTSSRAFAPSPAEREALTRALGGSSNTSLDRLPSLSDVGSLPDSPNHVHAIAHNVNYAQSHQPSSSTSGMSEMAGVRQPIWTPLPRLHTTFSPFADDDPLTATQANVGVEDNREESVKVIDGSH